MWELILCKLINLKVSFDVPLVCECKSSWRNRLARSTVNREVVGSIPTEDVFLYFFILLHFNLGVFRMGTFQRFGEFTRYWVLTIFTASFDSFFVGHKKVNKRLIPLEVIQWSFYVVQWFNFIYRFSTFDQRSRSNRFSFSGLLLGPSW